MYIQEAILTWIRHNYFFMGCFMEQFLFLCCLVPFEFFNYKIDDVSFPGPEVHRRLVLGYALLL